MTTPRRPLAWGSQRLDLRQSVDRITEDDRAMEFPLEDGENARVSTRGAWLIRAGGDGETEQAMGHGPAEGVVLAAE